MDPVVVIKSNWLTRKPDPNAFLLTYILGLALVAAGLFSDWISATPFQVFTQHEYWRAWTALFAHADMGHLISNSMILLPLCHFLTGYYGFWFFPFAGIFIGGITNLLVLSTMPQHVALLGISGVVNWMGSAWLTLYVIIDRRESMRRRLGVAVCLTMMLFVPETFRPEVSYLSHFVGFVLGIFSALGYYFIHRRTIEAAEVREVIVEDDFILPAGADL